ncbi:NAD+ synthase [Pseudomonas nitritireducens]|uniref:NH(3)-dependent NAD(+) synthetase n=1 Tax=Pseudomonas nitroreducens TaxID=46680 RepID=A0A7W7KQS2_PSENT|nr:ammonia-dependent NAD(+) synthetase [Pseudomonas nitritireducens]MBB4866835.1 NAD+ synthase [Pseudomonas nitritireducens]
MSTSKQKEIAAALGVKRIETTEELKQTICLRISWIMNRLLVSGCKTLVLGISGGVDSTCAGRLCQEAIDELNGQGQGGYKFIAVRLPYRTQLDEEDAQAALRFIKPSEVQVVNIGPAVQAIAGETLALEGLTPEARDFVLGNTKARMRMVAQYNIANATNGLVVGTDHASEAVMGFFTKFGDGACDIAPLSGLTKEQVRNIASYLGAPGQLVHKTPTADLEDLVPGKPDVLAFGCGYEEIENYLLGDSVDDRVAELIEAQYAKTQHKRELPYAP